MGDPFSGDTDAVPKPPAQWMSGIETAELTIAGCRCVVYRPKSQAKGNLLPGLLYMHGGGFVIGCSEDTDYTTRKLSLDNGLVVLSVNYPLAPEAMFPQALNTCREIWKWMKETAEQLGIDAATLYVGGDSAGGNLAAGIAQSGGAAGLIMLAPWLDMNVEAYESYNRLAPDGVVFDAAFIGYARSAYAHHRQWQDPLVSPIFARQGTLPPTFVAVGSEDPLFDQSVRFQANCLSGGTHIDLQVFDGMPHCFYSFPGLYTGEHDCYEAIREFIQKLRSTSSSVSQ
jgi:acetyl esterase